MAYRVVWSPRAVHDLEAVARYIAADSTAYAAAVVKTILNTARNFSRFPFSGRVVPELGDKSIREWIAVDRYEASGYSVNYLATDDTDNTDKNLRSSASSLAHA